MMNPIVAPYITASWVILGLVWLLAGFSVKKAIHLQSFGSLMLHIFVIAVAFDLLFKTHLRFGVLAERFVPDTPGVAYTGLALTMLGVLFAAWARLTIGRNWSATVTIKSQHTLVRRGPYSLVRHPIYSGLTLGMIGTALAMGEVGALVGIAIAMVGWYLKFRLEEQFMIEQFGAEYIEYRRQVKALIPYVL